MSIRPQSAQSDQMRLQSGLMKIGVTAIDNCVTDIDFEWLVCLIGFIL